MSRLTNIERTKLFDFFQIKNGYVLCDLYRQYNKSKTDTRNIIYDSVGVDIYADEKYKDLSQQKCIERIIEEFSNERVTKLFENIFDFFKFYNDSCKKDCFFCKDSSKCRDVRKIIDNLKIREDDELCVSLPSSEVNVGQLYGSLKHELENKNYVAAIDRLHTYSVSFLSSLCKKHSIVPNKDRHGHLMLDNMLTLLSNYYKEKNLIGDFAFTVIKANKEVFQKFNQVRNNESYSHFNDVTDNNNAKFVVSIIVAVLQYIETIENNSKEKLIDINDLPF